MRLGIFQQRKLLIAVCLGSIVSIFLLYHKTNLFSPTKRVKSSVSAKSSAKSTPRPRHFLPPSPVVWTVNASQWNLAEVRHIFFLKTHKTASSTLFSIFVRFSIGRQLFVMYPRDDHLLGEKSQNVATIVHHPPIPPFHFDIVCNHVIFNKDKLSPYLPQDTMYITILRKPLARVESAYDYYRNTHYHDEYLMRAPNFTFFMSHMDRYEPANPYISFTNNRMALDLGLNPHQLRNSSHVPVFLQHVSSVFKLVLIAERFDESVILLKRRLKWTLKDIMYAQLNRRNATGLTKIEASVTQRFEQFSQFDVALYDHFFKVFDETVRKEGPDFQAEVMYYRKVLHAVDKFCKMFKVYRGLLIEHPASLMKRVLKVPGSPWNKQFKFYPKECESIGLADHLLDRRAKYWQAQRMTLPT